MRNIHKVTVAVSPSIFGGEAKNQDRAVFDSKSNTCCLCDGITSSPYSEKAATIVTKNHAIILNNVHKYFKIAADLLLAHRDKAINGDIDIDDTVPASMRDVVKEAAKKNLKQSFQTTVIAVGFDIESFRLRVCVLSCGDSAFFAFSPTGELLFTNLKDINKNPEYYHQPGQYMLDFYKGRELLVRIIGLLSEFPELISKFSKQIPDKWFVCKPVSCCGSDKSIVRASSSKDIFLKPNELLLIPKYLVSVPKDPQYKEFLRVCYSQSIKRVTPPLTAVAEQNFDIAANATAVLPDHYYSGQWDYTTEYFPLGSSFLLGSDGFYKSFSNPSQMWQWLKVNNAALAIKKCKQQLLNDLHRRLNKKCGDDDISFIWITPKNRKAE